VNEQIAIQEGYPVAYFISNEPSKDGQRHIAIYQKKFLGLVNENEKRAFGKESAGFIPPYNRANHLVTSIVCLGLRS
jgi:hypothetical protein